MSTKPDQAHDAAGAPDVASVMSPCNMLAMLRKNQAGP
jgi:hypothetical protein